MKIKFQNLGSIKKAELDLRPLTVIIGPNNSNKTYIAYSIYGLWTRLNKSFLYAMITRATREELLKLGKNEKNNTLSLEINNVFHNCFVEKIEYIMTKEFRGHLLESFFQDSSRKIFEKTHFQLDISENDIKKVIHEISVRDFSIALSGDSNDHSYINDVKEFYYNDK
ncbi:MAG: AAA family ATPase, partial [Snowella sp.]